MLSQHKKLKISLTRCSFFCTIRGKFSSENKSLSPISVNMKNNTDTISSSKRYSAPLLTRCEIWSKSLNLNFRSFRRSISEQPKSPITMFENWNYSFNYCWIVVLIVNSRSLSRRCFHNVNHDEPCSCFPATPTLELSDMQLYQRSDDTMFCHSWSETADHNAAVAKL